MMDATRSSMLDRIETEIATLPRDDPRRNKLKFIRYGLLYGVGFTVLSRSIKAQRELDHAVNSSR